MATRTATPKSKTTEVRSERYRIRFDRRAQAALCARIAGTCRLVWNLLLADGERRYRLRKEYGQWTAIDKSVSFFTLGKRFTDLRSRPDADMGLGHDPDLLYTGMAKSFAVPV